MNTAPDPTTSTAIAATDQTKAAAAPRIKLLSHGFSIDHPDPELGEQLMADALGVADREAMHGIIRQLVKASVSGESPDEVNLSFMISMVKSIKPRDPVEAMLVAQMVSVHVMAMRCAHHLAHADDLAQHDSAARALGRLARTFPAQIEALNRYRSQGEPAITVQNVSVGDGGKAIRSADCGIRSRLGPKAKYLSKKSTDMMGECLIFSLTSGSKFWSILLAALSSVRSQLVYPRGVLPACIRRSLSTEMKFSASCSANRFA
jgi:hypothetical protein